MTARKGWTGNKTRRGDRSLEITGRVVVLQGSITQVNRQGTPILTYLFTSAGKTSSLIE